MSKRTETAMASLWLDRNPRNRFIAMQNRHRRVRKVSDFAARRCQDHPEGPGSDEVSRSRDYGLAARAKTLARGFPAPERDWLRACKEFGIGLEPPHAGCELGGAL